MSKINLGCGPIPKPGMVNVDRCDYGNPSIEVVDLNSFYWPFDDCTQDEVNAEMILEHLQDLDHAMRETHRILKPGGLFHITVPYWTGCNSWDDPTHHRAFTSQTLLYWTNSNRCSRYAAGSNNALFEVVCSRIEISATLPVLNIIPRLVGARVFDRCLAHLIPAQCVRLTLRKI